MTNSIAEALLLIEEDRQQIATLERDFLALIKKYDTRARKKNYSQRLSDLLARRIADDLRPSFPKIFPSVDGTDLESKAGGGTGPIKVDVRYHTDYGMGLGVSIKTINFVDRETRRYTKNMQRADKEFRSEAANIHQYQPHAVLIGLLLLPDDSRDDGRTGGSSFEHALHIFRHRSGRSDVKNDAELFERLLVGTYSRAPASFGDIRLHDVGSYSAGGEFPPDLTWEDFIDLIHMEFEKRSRRTLKRPTR